MTRWLFACPEPPTWTCDWAALEQQFAWPKALAACPQDPHHHAEGDVWTHTRMVGEALAADPSWRALEPDDRAVVYTAAVLHDIAKPVCTRTDVAGKISARGHSQRGAVLVRQMLWRAGVPFNLREQVVALVRYHQLPFFLVERDDAKFKAHHVSQTARCNLLAHVTQADAEGRECVDKPRLLDNIELFREFCRDEACYTEPRAFASDHARVLYFTGPNPQPDYAPHVQHRCEVVVMSGMPGAGKDSWIAANVGDWPVVSLDQWRQRLGIDPADDQGAVIMAAREQARELLRRSQRLVWNATNLSKQRRDQCIRLFLDYDARVRIVYIEASEPRLRQQNRARTAVVPDAVMARLLDRWEVPDHTEAHEVTWVAPDCPAVASGGR